MNFLKEGIQKVISDNAQIIASEVVDMQYNIQPGTWEKFGEKGRKLSIRDAGYHLPFLTEAIVSDDPAIFTDYVLWVKKLFKGLYLPDDVMMVTLQCTGRVLNKYLDKEQLGIAGFFIEKGLETLAGELPESETFIDHTEPLGELAANYNAALLSGDRFKAGKLIMDAVDSGAPIRDIYLGVFQKSQYEVGRLWLENKISVAKEHFCSAATQQIMAQLYPYIFSTERVGKTFVAACIGGELHEIGIRMVADFFEMEGWDTYYLGANSPVSTIISAIIENNANLVGLSVAMPYHRQLLREAILQIRNRVGSNVKIIIGGNALNRKIENLDSFHADAYAPYALSAVKLAKTLVN